MLGAMLAGVGLIAWWRLAGQRVPWWGWALAALAVRLCDAGARQRRVRGRAVGRDAGRDALAGEGGARRGDGAGDAGGHAGRQSGRLRRRPIPGVRTTQPRYDLAGIAVRVADPAATRLSMAQVDGAAARALRQGILLGSARRRAVRRCGGVARRPVDRAALRDARERDPASSAGLCRASPRASQFDRALAGAGAAGPRPGRPTAPRRTRSGSPIPDAAAAWLVDATDAAGRNAARLADRRGWLLAIATAARRAAPSAVAAARSRAGAARLGAVARGELRRHQHRVRFALSSLADDGDGAGGGAGAGRWPPVPRAMKICGRCAGAGRHERDRVPRDPAAGARHLCRACSPIDARAVSVLLPIFGHPAASLWEADMGSMKGAGALIAALVPIVIAARWSIISSASAAVGAGRGRDRASARPCSGSARSACCSCVPLIFEAESG